MEDSVYRVLADRIMFTLGRSGGLSRASGRASRKLSYPSPLTRVAGLHELHVALDVAVPIIACDARVVTASRFHG